MKTGDARVEATRGKPAEQWSEVDSSKNKWTSLYVWYTDG